jgi:myosin-5
LLSERQEKDAIKKALTEAGERNEELLMKIEDTNEKIEDLQNTIIKSVPSPILLDVSLFYSHPSTYAHTLSPTSAYEVQCLFGILLIFPFLRL